MRGSRRRSWPSRARPDSSISKATARWAACARVFTTPCRLREWRRWWPSCTSSSAVMAEARYRILTLNNISPRGLERLPAARYEIGAELDAPDAILVRSADLHGMSIPASVRAVGRAGAGVNNIPVGALSARGIPVFNTPGANANAVKELVLAGLLLAARNLGPAWLFARA